MDITYFSKSLSPEYRGFVMSSTLTQRLLQTSQRQRAQQKEMEALSSFVKSLPPELQAFFLSLSPQDRECLRQSLVAMQEKGHSLASIVTELTKQMPESEKNNQTPE